MKGNVVSKGRGRDNHDYRREITVNAPAERLFDAIATRDGVRGWWTPLVRGSSQRGRTLRLEFEGMDEHIDLRVVESRRPTEVEWGVVEHTSLDDWAGTKIRFQVSPAGDGTSTLAFQHVGLSPKLACYDQCEAGWDHFLGSLVAFAEGGKGAPFRARRARTRTRTVARDPAQSFAAVVAAFAKDRRVAPPAATRRAFGSNGLKVDGKIFAMLVRETLVVKLPRERVGELIERARGRPFDAGKGRPMKEWVTVLAPESEWVELAREARRFVGERRS